MLEIVAEDIAGLRDDDLRSLVALLTEATCRKAGVPSSAVTSGGDQDAPDGGIDVRVDMPSGTTVQGFVPRASTGFQVKKSPLGPARIVAEMRPCGILRPSIAGLASQGGAYVIVSSGASVTDAALKKRVDAMRRALLGHPDARACHLDFYDAQRLTTWLRDHPSLVPWVRSRCGRPMHGWQGLGDWSFGQATKLPLEGGPRLRGSGPRFGVEGTVDTVAGLELVRGSLAPRSSVRLAGLSGVGKTRFAEALFDREVGHGALHPSLAIYADAGQGCDPPPLAIASHLAQTGEAAVLVVDNCPPSLHGQLTRACRAEGSRVAVLTIEYDIREDLPEGSEAFHLEAASPDLVAALVRRRNPAMSDVDARTIGHASGGNARIGLALAHTLAAGETLAGLAEEDLFVRLFVQRHDPDRSLLAAAEACSLLYSFEAEADDHPREMELLAELAACDIDLLYGHVAELLARGLAQRRGRWRAVLPPAIADRLAARALKRTMPSKVDRLVGPAAPDRVFRSFSRRLGHLHASAEAVRITETWLDDPRLLAEPCSLTPFGMEILANVAPLSPGKVLANIERSHVAALLGAAPASRRGELARLIRHIAYEPDLFARCAMLLVALAAADKADGDSGEAGALLASMFSPYLSGTLATPGERFALMGRLLSADDPVTARIGVDALSQSLEAEHFSSTHSFEFGMRSRGYGYHPSSWPEVGSWYEGAVAVARQAGMTGSPSREAVRAAVAAKLRALCFNLEDLRPVEAAVAALGSDGFWEDGWVALRNVAWHLGQMPGRAERLAIVAGLRDALAPSGALDLVRVHVLREPSWLLDTDETAEGMQAAMDGANEVAVRLGEGAARDTATLAAALPLVLAEGGGLRLQFGIGLCRRANVPASLWRTLISVTGALGNDAGHAALAGFVHHWHSRAPAEAEAALDEATRDPLISAMFPSLQLSIPLGQAGLRRLRESLSVGAAPAWRYRPLYFADLSGVTAQQFAEFVEAIGSTQGGWTAAVEILAGHIEQGRRISAPRPGMEGVGRRLLLDTDFSDPSCGRLSHSLAIIAQACLFGQGAAPFADAVYGAILKSHADRYYMLSEIGDLLGALFKVQPHAGLNAFTAQAALQARFAFPTSEETVAAFDRRRNPFRALADADVLSWCDMAPAQRYPAAASLVPLTPAEPTAVPTWSSIALQLLERAPESLEVLGCFLGRFRPRSWGGSLATILEHRAGLLARLEESAGSSLASAAAAARAQLLAEAEKQRRIEVIRSTEIDGTFE